MFVVQSLSFLFVLVYLVGVVLLFVLLILSIQALILSIRALRKYLQS